ncbi:MAG: carboxylase [Candidatus Marinimicrobia bacterium CG08_land_8_20_14_0_20_45_22]|nr:MAG: carboxylase [Candidatus Marinimicrobia bacterium CG08_land_8_20_14_0_20_45_22]
MTRKLRIRDLTLRDGQQSQFATRMNQSQVDRLLPLYRQANFYAMEVWGGAVPDSVMRYLNENPWYRLESIKTGVGESSKLTALSRGRNLFGYNPYPDEVIEGFCRNAIQSGVDIMRIFDALNDLNNMRSTIKFVKENGGITDCAICYTVDPKFTKTERIKALFTGKKLPKNVFTVEYFLRKAKKLEKMGADMITIKDMAGLIHPGFASPLVKAFKKELSIPVDMHTHCTPGYGLATVLISIVNGVDIVDTVIGNFAGGPAAPAFELVQIFCNKLGIDTGVNLSAVVEINKHLNEIRQELSKFDETKQFPIEFDITKDVLPKEIDRLFDEAIDYAKADKIEKLLSTCQQIEKYFKYPPANEAVKHAEIPGGMYTNMLAQLQAAKLDQLLPKVLKIIPRVRLDAGCVPLVTPTSQIVGVQAVNCVVDEAKGLEPFYTTTSNQFVNLVKGSYGKTPIPVDPEFRKKITGSDKEIPYDTSSYKKQENPILPDCGFVKLAKNEKDELLLELFPMVASGYLKSVRKEEYEVEQEIENAKEKNSVYIQVSGSIE